MGVGWGGGGGGGGEETGDATLPPASYTWYDNNNYCYYNYI